MPKNKFSIFFNKYFPAYKPHRIIIAVMVIALLAFRITTYFESQKKSAVNTNNDNPIPVMNKASVDENTRTMGVMTFFHTSPLIGQIRVFSDWEGKYRTKEEGNKISFLYLKGRDGVEPELFSIAYYSEKDWEKNKNKKLDIMLKQEGTVFASSLNPDNDLEDPEAKEFKAMIGDVPLMIETFRTIKLNP